MAILAASGNGLQGLHALGAKSEQSGKQWGPGERQ